MQYDTSYKWNLIRLGGDQCHLLYRVRLLRIEYQHLIVYMELNQPGNFASLAQHISRFFMSFEEQKFDSRAQNEQTGTIPSLIGPKLSQLYADHSMLVFNWMKR